MSKTFSADSLLEGNASLMPEKQSTGGLEYVELGSLCLTITRGISIPSKTLMWYQASEFSNIVDIGTGAYKDHELQMWNATFLSEYLDEWSKGLVDPGDLLISKTITPPKAFVLDFPSDAKVIADSNLFVLKLDQTRIDPVYLMAYLNTREGQEQLKSKAEGAKRIKAIPIEAIRHIRIPVIPMSDQITVAMRFSRKIKRLMQLREKLEIVEESLGDLYMDEYVPDDSEPPHVFRIMER